MVASTPLSANNGPTHENEKRRKQTVERVKMTHLSRQLQMRLQYAKLKVDHGWQKQNLNEVENLYFHHSHQRIVKPFASPPIMTATLNDPSTIHSMTDPISNSSRSSPYSRTKLSSLTRDHTSTSLAPDIPSQSETATSNASTSQSTLANNRSLISQSTPSTPINPVEMRNLIAMEVEPENKPLPTLTPVTILTQYPQPTAGPSRISNYGTTNYSASQSSFSGDHALAPTPVATTWVTTGSRPPPPTSSPSSFSYYPNAPLQRTPTLPVSPSLSENSFSFPGVSLTYDSFWSSHSSSASTRTFRASTSSIVPVAASNVDSNGSMTDTHTFKSYQVPHLANTSGQKIGVRAAGKE
ncbi:hypothetical protein J132_05121 [Termitomyces sp. J132]|nr:hypothetical protein J132_05121 [Termitomyces sp. J132]